VRDHDYRVICAKRDRVMQQLERLFVVRPKSPGRKLSHPAFTNSRDVQRAADPNESNALFRRHRVSYALDLRPLREHSLDQRGLRVNRVVHVVWMRGTCV
jgi:hypothetical protein